MNITLVFPRDLLTLDRRLRVVPVFPLGLVLVLSLWSDRLDRETPMLVLECRRLPVLAPIVINLIPRSFLVTT